MQRVLFECDDDFKIMLKVAAAKAGKTTKDYLIDLVKADIQKQEVKE